MKKLVTIILVCILSVLFLFGCSSSGSDGSASDKKGRRECVVLCNYNCIGTIYFKSSSSEDDTVPTFTDCFNNIDGIVDDIFFIKMDTYAEYNRHCHIIVFYYAN